MRGRSRSRPVRWGFALLAYAFVGLALAGVALPGLPTVPFLLLAAWAASRGSERLHAWLHAHPRFGPTLAEWEEQGAVSVRSKVVAVSFIALSAVLMVYRIDDPWVLLGTGALLVLGATFVLTRPTPRKAARPMAGATGAATGAAGAAGAAGGAASDATAGTEPG